MLGRTEGDTNDAEAAAAAFARLVGDIDGFSTLDLTGKRAAAFVTPFTQLAEDVNDRESNSAGATNIDDLTAVLATPSTDINGSSTLELTGKCAVSSATFSQLAYDVNDSENNSGDATNVDVLTAASATPSMPASPSKSSSSLSRSSPLSASSSESSSSSTEQQLHQQQQQHAPDALLLDGHDDQNLRAGQRAKGRNNLSDQNWVLVVLVEAVVLLPLQADVLLCLL